MGIFDTTASLWIDWKKKPYLSVGDGCASAASQSYWPTARRPNSPEGTTIIHVSRKLAPS